MQNRGVTAQHCKLHASDAAAPSSSEKYVFSLQCSPSSAKPLGRRSQAHALWLHAPGSLASWPHAGAAPLNDARHPRELGLSLHVGAMRPQSFHPERAPAANKRCADVALRSDYDASLRSVAAALRNWPRQHPGPAEPSLPSVIAILPAGGASPFAEHRAAETS